MADAVETKTWYQSRTLWVNLVAAVAIFLSSQFGFTLSPEMQGFVLAGINIVLRLITKKAIA